MESVKPTTDDAPLRSVPTNNPSKKRRNKRHKKPLATVNTDKNTSTKDSRDGASEKDDPENTVPTISDRELAPTGSWVETALDQSIKMELEMEKEAQVMEIESQEREREVALKVQEEEQRMSEEGAIWEAQAAFAAKVATQARENPQVVDSEGKVEYTLLVDGFGLLKKSWVGVKNYHRYLDASLGLVERTSERSLAFISERVSPKDDDFKSTRKIPGTLQALEQETIGPLLEKSDHAISPYVAKLVDSSQQAVNKAEVVVEEAKEKAKVVGVVNEKIQPVVKVARKVLPIETVNKLAMWGLRFTWKNYKMIASIVIPQTEEASGKQQQ